MAGVLPIGDLAWRARGVYSVSITETGVAIGLAARTVLPVVAVGVSIGLRVVVGKHSVKSGVTLQVAKLAGAKCGRALANGVPQAGRLAGRSGVTQWRRRRCGAIGGWRDARVRRSVAAGQAGGGLQRRGRLAVGDSGRFTAKRFQ